MHQDLLNNGETVHHLDQAEAVDKTRKTSRIKIKNNPGKEDCQILPTNDKTNNATNVICSQRGTFKHVEQRTNCAANVKKAVARSRQFRLDH